MDGFMLFYAKNKFNACVSMTVSLLEATLLFVASRKIQVFFDQAVAKNDLGLVQQTLIIFAFLYLAKFGLGLLNSYFIHRIHYTGLLSMREKILDQLYKTRYQYFVNNTSAQLWSEINRTTNKLSLFYNAFIQIGVALFQILMYGYIIFRVSLIAGWLSVGVIPLISLMTFFVRKKFAHYEQKSMVHVRKIGGNAIESFDLVKMIKAKNEYHYFRERFRREHEKLNDQVVFLGVYQSYLEHFILAVTSLFPMFIIYIALGYGHYLDLSVGQIIVIYSMIPLFLNACTAIYTYVVRFFGVAPYLTKLYEYLELPVESSGRIRELPGYQIETQGICCDFGSRVVTVPDLTIHEREKILFCGESGIGKSTLFNILTGFLKDYQGTVRIGGLDLREIDLEALRGVVGISFQENKVFEGTLRENILLSHQVSEESFQWSLKKAMLEEFAQDLGDDLVNNDKLSGGEKARIQLAQTLLRKPKILLIDETLSKVDEGMEEKILRNIMEQFQDSIVLMISHRSSSHQYFDRVIQLGKGEQSTGCECGWENVG